MGNSSPVTNCKIIILGLDKAGKTTIVRLAENDFKPPADIDKVEPTVGHVVTHFISKENKNKIDFSCWDVSGKALSRELWVHYYKKTDAIVWVVDSTDSDERLEESKSTLVEVLSNIDLKDCCLLVCANKQDSPSAKSAQVITDVLGLKPEASGLSKRAWKVQSTCAKTGEGIKEAIQWIAEQIIKQSKEASKKK